MTCRRDAFAIAAESLVGTRFRLRGSDPRFGLDCVGVVICSLRAAGLRTQALPPYSLRNRDYSFIPDLAASSGFNQVSGQAMRGDVILVTPGPAQRHLLIAASGTAFIHAHAGIGRVVRMPGPVPWTILSQYRLPLERN